MHFAPSLPAITTAISEKPFKFPAPPAAVLIQDDSAKAMKSILTNSVSAVICDPPYGIDFGDFDWDNGIPGFGIWRECFRVLKPGGYMVAFGASRTSHELTTLLEKIGFIICGRLVWEYPNGTPACQPIGDEHHARVKPAHEDIILVMKPIAAKTMKAHREKYGNCGRRVKDTLGDGTIKMTTSVFAYNKASPSERNIGVEHLPKRRLIERDESGRSLYKESKHQNYHPCVKPVELLAHLSRLLAEPGDTILDPFMGSGSGGLAAIWHGFNYIGIERDPGYFKVATARIEFALNNTAPPFPLDSKARKVFAKTERRRATSGLNWTIATDDLRLLGLARDTSFEPAAFEYEPVAWRKPKATAPAKPKALRAANAQKAKAVAPLPDGAVDQGIVAFGRHTEETLPAAGLGPDIANLPLDGFRLVEVPRFRIMTGIVAVSCGDEVIAGRVTLSPMELMPLFRRSGTGPTEGVMRRIQPSGRQDWLLITDPVCGIMVVVDDMMIMADEVHAFEEENDMMRLARTGVGFAGCSLRARLLGLSLCGRALPSATLFKSLSTSVEVISVTSFRPQTGATILASADFWSDALRSASFGRCWAQ